MWHIRELKKNMIYQLDIVCLHWGICWFQFFVTMDTPLISAHVKLLGISSGFKYERGVGDE
jgi:hypothetical protein